MLKELERESSGGHGVPKIQRGRDSGTRKQSQSWSRRGTALAGERWALGKGVAGKNMEEALKGTGIQRGCKVPEAAKSSVSFKKLIRAGRWVWS